MTLYNCRHDGDTYRITKFDEHQNVESSYLCTTTECECPAGQRPRCRHREMLPKFIARKAVGTGWWLDFDRGGWVQMHDDLIPATEEAENEVTPQMLEDAAEYIDRNPSLGPAAEAIIPARAKSWRRF
jgi:hypothetical protein